MDQKSSIDNLGTCTYRFQMSKALGIRLTWHLSYAALLSVPILIFILVSWGTSRALEDQLEQSSSTLVDLMGKDIDGKLESVSRLINDVTWDPLAQTLMNLPRLDTGAQRFDMVRLADHLTVSAGYSRFSDFVFVAFPNLGVVLIPTSQYTEEQFYRSYFLGPGLSREGFHALLVQRHDGDSRSMVYQNALGHSQDAVLILKSLPPSPSIPAAACLGILINTETIVASLHGAVKDSRSEIQILNDQGEIIVSTMKAPWQPSAPNMTGARIQGVDYTVLQRQTQKFAWTVQLLVPDSIIKGNLLFAQLVILVGLASCLILGIWLTIYLVRRNYGPVSRVLEALSSLSPRGGEPEGDEFSQIQRTVSLVRDRLEQSKEPLRQNLAAGLLRGRIEIGISLEDRLSALGIVFLTQEFVVCLVQVDEGGPASDDLHRKLEAAFEPWGTCLKTADEMPLVFILNLNQGSTSQTLPDLQEAVASWAPPQGMACAFSSVVQGVAAIPLAWGQAKTALEYRFVVGGDQPFAWDQLKAGQPARFYQYDGEKEGRLLTLTKAGETEAAATLLDEIFAENSQPDGVRLSPVAAQCLIWELAATMMKALAEVSGGDQSFTSLFQPVATLAQGTPWDKARSGLQNLLRDACTYARTQNSLRQAQLKSGSSLQFVQQVCEYLQAHSADPTLDLTKIADAHNLTPAYLSRLFRENAEEGIFDYLHRLRIEHAKSLLRSGSGNLHDIGLACGFVDVKTFIRNFRRFTGITPGKFRETS